MNMYGINCCRLVVSNLNFRTSVDDIYAAFSKFGKLNECKLLLGERHESKGIAFISFANINDGRNAREQMEGFKIDGRCIHIEYMKSSSEL